jgi:HSP20 family protein
MTIVRYTPWQEMSALQRQLESMFNDVSSVTRNHFPAAELTETETYFALKLEVPGMKLSDLDIQVMADRVFIAGDRVSENKDKTISEFRYGKFQRAITLPKTVQNTKVTAEYKDGILKLTLPKTEAEKNRVVKVNLSEVTN